MGFFFCCFVSYSTMKDAHILTNWIICVEQRALATLLKRVRLQILHICAHRFHICLIPKETNSSILSSHISTPHSKSIRLPAGENVAQQNSCSSNNDQQTTTTTKNHSDNLGDNLVARQHDNHRQKNNWKVFLPQGNQFQCR